ncbi:hypothetical protein F5Y10DRAFT_242255 [Nemania abortiva]|nr:hypothetical protein F5Y10DRAFT_242255 [Nemania abortiva]
MQAFLNGHAKARNRSVQLDNNPVLTQVISAKHREPIHTPPIPARTDSMANQENQNPSVRQYRSMLVVDAPSLGPHKPISYDEFHVGAIPGIFASLELSCDPKHGRLKQSSILLVMNC